MDFIVRWSEKNIHLLEQVTVKGKFRTTNGRVIRVQMEDTLPKGTLVSEDITILDTYDERKVKKDGKTYVNKIYHWE